MRGFLLIDQKLNAVLVPDSDKVLVDSFKWDHLMDSVKHHNTKTDLMKTIRRYLNSNSKEDTL